MRILKYKSFAKWAKDEKINDNALALSVDEVTNGLVDANLGGNVYKKRVSRKGQGKRSGYRTIIAFKKDQRVIFILGFAKNEKDSVTTQEMTALKRVAKDYLSFSEAEIDKLIQAKELIEVKK